MDKTFLEIGSLRFTRQSSGKIAIERVERLERKDQAGLTPPRESKVSLLQESEVRTLAAWLQGENGWKQVSARQAEMVQEIMQRRAQ